MGDTSSSDPVSDITPASPRPKRKGRAPKRKASKAKSSSQDIDFTKFTLKKRRFLQRFAQCGTITHAARYAGVSRPTIYAWRREEDGEFAKAFDDAQEMACDALEVEARKRAVNGHSDTLLIFLLKGARPEKYKDRAVIDHGNKDDKPFVIETVPTADPDDWGKTVEQELHTQRAMTEQQASGEQ
jgi:hypothetical protein